MALEGVLELGHRTFGLGELAVMVEVEPGAAPEVVRAAEADGADIVAVAGIGVEAYVAAFRALFPELVIGVSRGAAGVEIDGMVVGPPVLVSLPGHDLAGSLAAAAVAAWEGARVFRVGQRGWVRETRRALRMVAAIRGDIPPAYAVRGLA